MQYYVRSICAIFFYAIANIIGYADDVTLYACEPNMDLVLVKLAKDTSSVFTGFQGNYFKAISGKSPILTTSDNINVYKCWGESTQWYKYEDGLGIRIDHKLIFENHLLNIVQKVNQKLHALGRISKYMPQKKVRITMKHLPLHSLHIAH